MKKKINKEHPLSVITGEVAKLHWQIAIPNEPGDAKVTGMIIGTAEYIDKILGMEKENFREFEIPE